MKQDRQHILTASVKRLLRRNATRNLRKIVNKAYGVDLSILFRELSLQDQLMLFDMIKNGEQKGILLSELDKDLLVPLVGGMEQAKIVAVLEAMPNDDVADLLHDLPEETADGLLKLMKEDSDAVENLMGYEADTAGGIMNPDFIAINQEISAKTPSEKFKTNLPTWRCRFICTLWTSMASWWGWRPCGNWSWSSRRPR